MTTCGKCGGPVWDNRVDKKNPKGPDLKCKDANCGWVQWPPKGGSAPAPAYQPPAVSAAPRPVGPTALGTVIEQIGGEYAECLTRASMIAQSHGITDHQAIVAMAATLFIQWNKSRAG